MTRSLKPPRTSAKTPRVSRQGVEAGPWVLRDAEAHFGELVRRVHSDGPQRVAVDGRDDVVVISADEFRRLNSSLTGMALIEAMQASPHRDVEIEPDRYVMHVREVPV